MVIQRFGMKQKKINGFTIIELLVVIAIMGLVATLLVINFNTTRSRRNLALGANELVTNVRKTQSYALSARDVSPNLPAKYYVLQFDFSTPGIYKILAIDTNYAATPKTVETINLPVDVVLDQNLSALVQPISGGTTTHPGCLQVLFGLPYGRIYMAGSASPCSNGFVNTAMDPAAMSFLTNSKGTIYLRTNKGAVYTKTAEINGLSGTITSQ